MRTDAPEGRISGGDPGESDAELESVCEGARELEAVWEGLRQDPKRISSRYFYDTRGSELFVRITKLPEYYPTRTEYALLDAWAEELVRRIRPASLLELGAGSARKTRILLDQMEAQGIHGCYLPVDVSAEFLEDTAAQLRREYPHLEVRPVEGDLTHPLDPNLDAPRPLLLAFLGSTIGNFTDPEATAILRNVARFLRPGDHFLLGVDLRPSRRKSLAELEAAYNDGAGVTAEFNRNALRVLNRRFGTDFQEDAYRHHAFYNEEEGRIEMHLLASVPQRVKVPGRGEIRFEAGESVRTEISCKYDRDGVHHLFATAGLELEEWIADDHDRYALVLGRPS